MLYVIHCNNIKFYLPFSDLWLNFAQIFYKQEKYWKNRKAWATRGLRKQWELGVKSTTPSITVLAGLWQHFQMWRLASKLWLAMAAHHPWEWRINRNQWLLQFNYEWAAHSQWVNLSYIFANKYNLWMCTVDSDMMMRRLRSYVRGENPVVFSIWASHFGIA